MQARYPFWFLLLAINLSSAVPVGTPHLEKRTSGVQLVVDGRPFLMLAAELHNSSSSSLEYMKEVWPRLAAIPLNTVLTPLSWELVEPEEGKFNFTLIDGLLKQARENHLKIVFLWLATWKNGMSSYAPVWVKADTQRFPRVIANGKEVEILSTLGKSTLEEDSKAFASVMRHLREVDSTDHTVLMMQVENEVGVLGDTRDYSAAANRAFNSAVPEELTRYLASHRETLYPELRGLWDEHGRKASGSWEEVFGASPRTDEIFMAWNYGRYVQAVAAAGKAAYDIPMYVNTWLATESATPGIYPSGGPQPRVIDIWKAAGTAIDIFSPDIYQRNFTEWCGRYNRAGNPLFIPETNGAATGEANAFYAFGERSAIGFSPFGIDSWNDSDDDLGKTYRVLQQLTPLLLQHQAQGDVHGFLLDAAHPAVTFVFNGIEAQVSLDQIFGTGSEEGFGMLLETGPTEFIGAGRGFRVRFKPRTEIDHLGLAAVEDGHFADGAWVPGRRLNGDEDDQGQYWRFDKRETQIEKAVLYRYR